MVAQVHAVVNQNPVLPSKKVKFCVCTPDESSPVEEAGQDYVQRVPGIRSSTEGEGELQALSWSLVRRLRKWVGSSAGRTDECGTTEEKNKKIREQQRRGTEWKRRGNEQSSLQANDFTWEEKGHNVNAVEWYTWMKNIFTHHQKRFYPLINFVRTHAFSLQPPKRVSITAMLSIHLVYIVYSVLGIQHSIHTVK